MALRKDQSSVGIIILLDDSRGSIAKKSELQPERKHEKLWYNYQFKQAAAKIQNLCVISCCQDLELMCINVGILNTEAAGISET
jgi:hypothetical protein